MNRNGDDPLPNSPVITPLGRSTSAESVRTVGGWLAGADRRGAPVASPWSLGCRFAPPQPPVAEDLLRVLEAHFARWQLPRAADIHFVTTLPKTSVGKLDKKTLRRLVAETSHPFPAQAREEGAHGGGVMGDSRS